MRQAAPFAFALCAGLSLAPRVTAAPCGRPDVDFTFPPNDADDVPPNAMLAAHYRAPADYVDESVTVVGPSGEVTVDVFYDVAESMLRALPRDELVAGRHEVRWPGLRGVATSRGLGRTVEFSVGTARDEEAPRFSGLRNIDWDLLREHDECTDSQTDRFIFELGVGSATDDAPPELLAVVVFETREAGQERGSPEQLAVRPMPESGRLSVERPAVGEGKVCFAAVTRDLVNNVSGGGDEEVCVKTSEPPFFDGCSLATGRSRSSWMAVALAFALGLFAKRRGARRG